LKRRPHVKALKSPGEKNNMAMCPEVARNQEGLVHLTLLDLIILIIFTEEYKL
jgi:hypothetical protein